MYPKYFNNNTAYLLMKRHPRRRTAQSCINLYERPSLHYLAHKSLLHAGVKASTCIPVIDSGEKKKKAAVNSMFLFLFNISHLLSFYGKRKLRDKYSFATLGEFNSVVPFSYTTLYHSFRFDTLLSGGKARVGPLVGACASTLWLAALLANSCSCLGFLASIAKWAACAS